MLLYRNSLGFAFRTQTCFPQENKGVESDICAEVKLLEVGR